MTDVEIVTTTAVIATAETTAAEIEMIDVATMTTIETEIAIIAVAARPTTSD